MSDDLATLVAVCEKAAKSKFSVTIDPVAVLPVVRTAATALTEARAEIERLTEQALVKDHAIIEAAKLAKRLMTRAVAAESELSTLRARVREVVGPFADLAQKYDDTVSDGWISWAEFVADDAWPTETNCRAARQLLEDLK